MKKKLLYHPDTKLYEFDGKFYDLKKIKYKKIGKVEHEDVHVYEEVNVEKLDELRKSISNKLKVAINPERIIEEVLKGSNEKTLKKLKEKLESKGAKISTHNGCYGIEIDTGEKHSTYVSLFD
ncbi:hypothetical protein LCGC14_0571050 [marine sediment metagenome]|uniref:Uncharacterized protein n=1 Tax=marine sediment metagenome TaxID=412755 RepID=A0A0F9S2R3_9ZZZZ